MRKGITPVIGVIILVLIVIALVASAYSFVFGVFTSLSSKTIRMVPGSQDGNKVIIQNIGTDAIQPGELTVSVNGQDAGIINPVKIDSRESKLLEFNPPVIGKNLRVRIIGPTNSVNYIVDIIMDVIQIILNSPDNDADLTNNALLNWSVNHFYNQSMEIMAFAGNDTGVLDEALVYYHNDTYSGTYTYNYTFSVIQGNDPSIVLLMHLDNRSEFGENNDIVNDFSGYGNDGIVNTSVPVIAGKLGGAYEFNGIMGNVSVSNPSWNITGSPTNSFTLAAWFYPRDNGDYGGIALSSNNFAPRLKTFTDQWEVQLRGAETNAQGRTLFVNKWQHVVGTYNATSERLKIYQNGSLMLTSGPVINNDTSAFNDGVQIGYAQKYFNGTIDEVVVWNRTLSDQEIQDLYELQAGQYHWRVEATDGTESATSETRNFDIL